MKLYSVTLEALVHVVATDEESAIGIARDVAIQHPLLIFASECRVSLHPRAYEPFVNPPRELANLDYIPDTPLADPPEF